MDYSNLISVPQYVASHVSNGSLSMRDHHAARKEVKRMQREILAVVIELLVTLTRRTIDQFFPDRGIPVADALALLHAVETLALRQMQGHQTTVAMLSRRTQIPRQTLTRYLQRMQRAGLIYAQGRNYYVDLNLFNTPENAAHLAAKVDCIIRAANQIARIQNARSSRSVA
jgi:hypothetical protein